MIEILFITQVNKGDNLIELMIKSSINCKIKVKYLK